VEGNSERRESNQTSRELPSEGDMAMGSQKTQMQPPKFSGNELCGKEVRPKVEEGEGEGEGE
jgi:hypothetical protein